MEGKRVGKGRKKKGITKKLVFSGGKNYEKKTTKTADIRNTSGG